MVGPLSKLDILQRFFVIRSDTWALQYADGHYERQKTPLTSQIFNKHLAGTITTGPYLLNQKNQCRDGVLDFDRLDDATKEATLTIQSVARHYGIELFIENSGQKGYHGWCFFEPLPAVKIRLLLHALIREAEKALGRPIKVEVFPKQDTLRKSDRDKDRFGNFVKAPWGKHQVTSQRTAFLDHGFKEIVDQEGLFSGLEPVSEEKIDEILEELGANLAPARSREIPNRKRERTEQENEHALALLVDNCAFIQHTRDDAKELAEPQWWSMCTILVSFGEAGERLIHDFSRPYQKENRTYSENETRDKINQIRAAQADETGLGFQSCAYIRDTYAFDCPPDCQAKLLGVASPAGLASKLAAKAKQPTYPTVKETPAEVRLPLPALPEGAWYGLFADYRELVGETTEAPDSYHFASFALVKGAVLGRRLHVYHARRLYPNFYICLVGRTALSRKDTAWSRGRGILLKLHDETDVADPIFQIIPGIGSAEGLIDALGGVRKVVVLNESELLALMNKAKQESLSNLIPKLTALYDCPDRETLKTRQKAVEAKEPFVSIISGSTQAWLQTAFTKREIYGGFANRFMFISGDYKEPMPFPPKADAKKQDRLIASLNKIRSWAQGVYEATGGELAVPPETKERFSHYYEDYYKRCASETLSAALIPRVQDFVWKLALLHAAMDFSDSILVPHLEAGIAAGDFLERSALHIFQDFGADKNRENENQLLQYLRTSQNGAVPWRDAYRALHMSAGEFEKIVQPLMRLGIVQALIAKNEKNQKVKVIQLPTD